MQMTNYNMETKEKFECDRCGCCCMQLDLSELYRDLDRGDGVCKYLDMRTKLCSIYDERPVKCNVEQMYYLFFEEIMSKERFYEINHSACMELKQRRKQRCI